MRTVAVERDDPARRLTEELERRRQSVCETLTALRHDANVGRQPRGDLPDVADRTNDGDIDADGASQSNGVFDERPVQ
jgi:hypothetical protein